MLNKQDIINLLNEGKELHFDSEFNEKMIEKDHKIKVKHIGQYDDESTLIDGLEIIDGDIVYQILEHI